MRSMYRFAAASALATALAVAEPGPALASQPSAGSISASAPSADWEMVTTVTPNAIGGFDCRDAVPLAPSCDSYTLTTLDAGFARVTLWAHSNWAVTPVSLNGPKFWVYGEDGELVAESDFVGYDCGECHTATFAVAAATSYRIVSGDPLGESMDLASAMWLASG